MRKNKKKQSEKITSWNKVNNLTNIAYRMDKKKKIWFPLTIILFLVVIISTFVFTFAYAVRKMYNNVNYKSIPFKLDYPTITDDDIKNLKIYDSDLSVLYSDLIILLDAQLEEFINMNYFLKLLFAIENIDSNEITIELFKDKNFLYKLQPTDLLYAGQKQFYLEFFYKDQKLDLTISPIKFDFDNQAIFFTLFSMFKNLTPIYKDTGLQHSGYFPETFYAKNFGQFSNNFELYTEVNNELNKFLANEIQETSNYNNLDESLLNNKLRIVPYITTNPIVYVDSYSQLSKLQNWFKLNKGKYLSNLNYSSGVNPLDLSKNQKIYFTFFPFDFNDSDFINANDPIAYFKKLKYSNLPIYQGYYDVQKSDFIQISHNYSVFDYSNALKQALLLNYTKHDINVTDNNIINIKNQILNYTYESLKSSIISSYQNIPGINISEDLLLKEFFNISKPSDLIPHINFYDIYHNSNNLTSFDNLTIANINDIRCINFNLSFQNSYFKNINDINNNNWLGSFIFYEK